MTEWGVPVIVTDIVHVLVGALTGFLSSVFVPSAVLISVMYIVYQVIDPDPVDEKAKDVGEFLIGFVIGFIAMIIVTTIMVIG